MNHLLEYCIEKPVAPIILNILLIILGLISLNNLSTREYPVVSQSKFTITTTYPNASAETIEQQVTIPIEDYLDQIPGIDNINSESMNNSSKISINFASDISQNDAIALIRDKITMVRHLLPTEIQEPKIDINNNNFFMTIALTGEYISPAKLSHFATVNITGRLSAIPGIAGVYTQSPKYRMEVSLDSKKLAAFSISTQNIIHAIRQNTQQLPVGKINDVISISFDGTLKSREEIANIIVLTRNNTVIRLSDVAEVKLLTDDQEYFTRVNGKPALLIHLGSSTTHSSITTAKMVHEQIQKIKTLLPSDTKIDIIYDSSIFVKDSLNNIYFSLLEAIFFVAIIIFLFLRNKTLLLIPIITIPISLIGTLTVLYVFGYSINTLTIMALVLSIGLVVDDAIIVLENIARKNSSVNAKKAAKLGVKEICFSIIAMTLTIVSVYLPLILDTSIISQLFKEFAVALSSAIVISGFVSLSLSPLMCSRLLNNNHSTSKIHPILETIIRKFLKYPKINFAILILAIISGIIIYLHLPKTLAPIEDRNIFGSWSIKSNNTPTREFINSVKIVEKIYPNIPEIKNYWLNMETNNGGTSVVAFKNSNYKSSRTSHELQKIIQKQADSIPDLTTFAWVWDNHLPHIKSNQKPASIDIVILTFDSYTNLNTTIENILEVFKKHSSFGSPYSEFDLNRLSYDLSMKKEMINIMGYKYEDITTNLQVAFDKYIPAKFYIDNIAYDIILKTNGDVADLAEVYVMNDKGYRTTLDNLVSMQIKSKPNNLSHTNKMRSAKISIPFSDLTTFSEKLEIVKQILQKELPPGYSFAFTDSTKQYLDSTNTLFFLTILSILFIYAILAIQFESFIDPLIILFSAPLAALGAITAIYFYNDTVNIYTQIGLITLIGLITKHGVLLLDFTNKNLLKDRDIHQAVLKATITRARPILMTSLAMVMSSGVLMFSSGSGHETRQAIGMVLFYGLSIGTIFTLLILPSCILIIKQLSHRKIIT